SQPLSLFGQRRVQFDERRAGTRADHQFGRFVSDDPSIGPDVAAPIAGRTGAVGATVGNLAVSGQTELVRIAGMQPMHAWFSLPLAQLPALREAMRVGPVAVTAIPEGGAQAEEGTVELVENGSGDGTGSVRVRARLANAGDRLWPDMQCRIEVRLGVERGVLTVPVRALQTGQDGATVWTIGADRTARPVRVRVLRVAGDVAVLEGGLEDGVRIVVDGQMRLTPGCAVVEAGGEAARAERR
ncbi:MAG: efflux RND transporter periplasmic adaptor subunit, partial [Planctomycetes bacterium]|nr:efflux RND transporter periplasmic adaptor subunit [Planctomycetota bacterium]